MCVQQRQGIDTEDYDLRGVGVGGDREDSDESFVQFLINQMTTIDLSNRKR